MVRGVALVIENLAKISEKAGEYGTKIAEKNGKTLWEAVEDGKRTLTCLKADGTVGRTVTFERYEKTVYPFSENIAAFAKGKEGSARSITYGEGFNARLNITSTDANGELANIYRDNGDKISRNYYITLRDGTTYTRTHGVDSYVDYRSTYGTIEVFERGGYTLAKHELDGYSTMRALNPYGEEINTYTKKEYLAEGDYSMHIHNAFLADGSRVYGHDTTNPIPQRLRDLGEAMQEYFFPKPVPKVDINKSNPEMVAKIKEAVDKTAENIKANA